MAPLQLSVTSSGFRTKLWHSRSYSTLPPPVEPSLWDRIPLEYHPPDSTKCPSASTTTNATTYETYSRPGYLPQIRSTSWSAGLSTSDAEYNMMFRPLHTQSRSGRAASCTTLAVEDEYSHEKRICVEIAGALPPDYLEAPPTYQSTVSLGPQAVDDCTRLLVDTTSMRRHSHADFRAAPSTTVVAEPTPISPINTLDRDYLALQRRNVRTMPNPFSVPHLVALPSSTVGTPREHLA